MAPITVTLKELNDHPGSGSGSKSTELGQKIESALGTEPGSLGIILVSGLGDEFPNLREKMFLLAHKLANASDIVKAGLERPEEHYLFGWSHGKEKMNGKLDFHKGSFYANPLLDKPKVTDEERAAHPEYYSGNVWPSAEGELKEFEQTFKALGKVIYDVGIALARACEAFVATNGRTIESLISSSQSNKARLLHYYPETAPSDPLDDSLCGTHIDHSLLTGLCSAMYISTSEDGVARPVPSPSSTAGLYIYPRSSKDAIKVSIPPDCLAFQTGECLELLTGGKLAATPHFVSGNAGSSISRETFAFFLQPDVDDVVGPSDGETFGEFSKRVNKRHYESEAGEA